jgi:hypothetical protein
MPRNGEINKEFGIYENLCCGAEIVIPEGVTFPHCAKHLDIVTDWRNVSHKDRFIRAVESERDDSAA